MHTAKKKRIKQIKVKFCCFIGLLLRTNQEISVGSIAYSLRTLGFPISGPNMIIFEKKKKKPKQHFRFPNLTLGFKMQRLEPTG